MTKAHGFARGDLDTSFPLDDKFVELRAATDPAGYYAATGVYFHVVAATWREAERKPASRVTPDATEIIALLVRVGLLDSDECVQRRAYTHSIGRALRARRTSADRKSRNRAGMSRPVPRDTRARHATSTDIQSGSEQVSTGQISTEQSGSATRGPNGHVDDGDDPYDVVVQWLAGRKAWVQGRVQTDLARMVDRKGAEAVIAAMAAVPDAEEGAQFVYGARNALFPLAGSRVTKPEEPDPRYVRDQLDQQRRARANA